MYLYRSMYILSSHQGLNGTLKAESFYPQIQIIRKFAGIPVNKAFKYMRNDQYLYTVNSGFGYYVKYSNIQFLGIVLTTELYMRCSALVHRYGVSTLRVYRPFASTIFIGRRKFRIIITIQGHEKYP